MSKKISIYIVEDYMLARITFEQALECYEELDVKGAFESGEDCIAALEKEQVDIVVMDIGLPYMTGIEATKIIKERFPDVKVIMLTSHNKQDEIISSFASGANGYALKEISTNNLHEVIKTVANGSLWVAPQIANIVQKLFFNFEPAPEHDFNLTEREKEVLGLLVQGLSNTEISERLIISTHTVKVHVANILSKLAVSDRVQAAVKAVKFNL